MPKFMVTEPIHEAGLEVLRAAGEVVMASGQDEDTLIAEVGDIDGMVLRAKGRITRRVLENAPKLKVVGRHGVGVDNVDLEAATECGVQIVNTPLATVEGVAEHAVGMMLALSKQMGIAERMIRSGRFAERYSIEGREVRGRTLGVIGCGRIGRRVAQICRLGFDMPVLYCDVVAAPDLECELGARKVSLEELLATAEYITVHVPLLPETTKMIGRAQFALMKPEAMFFNLSRGPVVDEAALIEALQEGRIAGAGIDVYEQEPTPPDNPLLAMDNVVVTPHVASSTAEALRMMSLVAEDVVAVVQGRPPKFPVNHLA